MPVDRFGLLDPITRSKIEQAEMVSSQVHNAAHVAKGLRDLDPRLKLTFFGENAEARYNIVPGRWHVFLDNEWGKPDMYYPIQTDDGGYREPDWGVVEAMKMADSWSSDYELPTDDIQEHQAGVEKQKALASDQRKDQIASDYEAAKRVAGDGGLTRRKWGRGGVKGLVGS